VDAAVERGLLAPEDLYMSRQRARPTRAALDRAADEVTGLLKVAQVVRGPSEVLAPSTLVESLRELVSSQRLEIFRS
jgi:hypothetical protein